MRHVQAFCIFVILLSSLGCVTTKEYQARISDIEGLKKDKTGLEQQLQQRESEKADLEAQVADLLKKVQELEKQNTALSEDNANLDNLLKAGKDELTAKVSDLRSKLSEKEHELSRKNLEIVELKSQVSALTLEKDALTAEKEGLIREIGKERAAKDAEIEELRRQTGVLSQEKERALTEKEQSIAELKKTYDSLANEMKEEVRKGEITITQLKDRLTMNLVEKILFDSGSAEIKQDGKKVLDRVANILKKVSDKQVRVEGHTDNVRIGPRIASRFPTNWELSATRATTVARYLQDKGIDPKLLSASAYSEYRPVTPNTTDEGKMKNRRIEIALIPHDADQPAAPEGAKK